MNLKQAIEKVKTDSKKRNFVQSLELIINFKKIDFKKPENRINVTAVLPKGRGKKIKVAAIVGDELVIEAKKYADKVILKSDLEELKKNKKEAKRIAKHYDFFIAQTDLMADVGKILGQILGPKGKMPRPVPPTAKLEKMLEAMQRNILIKMKGKFLPTVQSIIGTEEMSTDDLVINASSILDSIKNKLPNREGNIKSVYVKTTMGKSVRVNELK